MILEFLLPRRPVSHQSKSSKNREAWKAFVETEAKKAWQGQVMVATPCQLTLIYFCNDQPIDIDNIIKPIQDALVGLVYVDDTYVTDVDSHRRPLIDSFNFTRLPSLIQPAVEANRECVYVRITLAKPLESYL